MLTLPIIFFIFITLIFVALIYFKIASRYNIIDKPNERSSHRTITLRGGGILFCIAGIIFYIYSGFQYHFFIIGLLAISTISFLDDILTLNNRVRLAIHAISVLMLLYQWDLFVLPWYWLLIASIFVVGTINAYNFMDGINGITGGYSFITISTLYFINTTVVNFTSNDFLIIIGLSLLVFNFFNFRTKAKCFAGDVGSVSIAFIIVFLIGQLILQTQNFAYILLLLFYGLDSATTIFFRKLRKENIFEAHRSHFYQYLANRLFLSHLWISAIYMIVQLLINVVLIFFIKDSALSAIIFFIAAIVVFLALRFKIEGQNVLLANNPSS